MNFYLKKKTACLNRAIRKNTTGTRTYVAAQPPSTSFLNIEKNLRLRSPHAPGTAQSTGYTLIN